ncbi:DNA repair protein RecO [Thermodesulfobacteriota bacterium]
METYLSQAIIMRIREFGETDLLVTFFTPEKGQLKGVAKGARKSRKRFVNCLDVFSLVNLEYGLKRQGALYFLQSGKLLDGYAGLRADFSSVAIASYMIELTEVLFPQSVADGEAFDLLKAFFGVLARGESGEKSQILFETRAMALGGYGINVARCTMCRRAYTGQGMAVFKREKGGIACLGCARASTRAPLMGPESVKALSLIQTSPFSELLNIVLEDTMVNEIRPVLKLHREYRLERRLKTAKYIE